MGMELVGQGLLSVFRGLLGATVASCSQVAPRQGAVRGDGLPCTCRRASLGRTHGLWAEAAFQVAAPSAAWGLCRCGWVLMHWWRE